MRKKLFLLTDHPRVCGEHEDDDLYTAYPQGSSPRMRGAHWHLDDEWNRAGIIPAYAGSTHDVNTTNTGEGDHPRVCGEHG